MNKYIITSLVECSLHFNKFESAKKFADRNELQVCQVFYLDEHIPIFLGFGIENENGLLTGNELQFGNENEI